MNLLFTADSKEHHRFSLKLSYVQQGVEHNMKYGDSTLAHYKPVQMQI